MQVSSSDALQVARSNKVRDSLSRAEAAHLSQDGVPDAACDVEEATVARLALDRREVVVVHVRTPEPRAASVTDRGREDMSNAVQREREQAAGQTAEGCLLGRCSWCVLRAVEKTRNVSNRLLSPDDCGCLEHARRPGESAAREAAHECVLSVLLRPDGDLAVVCHADAVTSRDSETDSTTCASIEKVSLSYRS